MPREDAEEEEDSPRDAKEDKEDKIGHRAIPTWEEAVGLIVTTNLEARAKRPNGGSSRGHPSGHGPREGRGGREQRRGQKRPPGKRP